MVSGGGVAAAATRTQYHLPPPLGGPGGSSVRKNDWRCQNYNLRMRLAIDDAALTFRRGGGGVNNGGHCLDAATGLESQDANVTCNMGFQGVFDAESAWKHAFYLKMRTCSHAERACAPCTHPKSISAVRAFMCRGYALQKSTRLDRKFSKGQLAGSNHNIEFNTFLIAFHHALKEQK